MSGESSRRQRSISTGGGDAGETSLLYGQRVSKTHPQVEACGCLDELSAALGMARAIASADAGLQQELEAIQVDLIALMGELAAKPEDLQRYLESTFPKIDEPRLRRLGEELARLEEAAGELQGWALPGKNLLSASIEVARTTARRAERSVIHLRETGFPVRPVLGQYLNRLSDLLWLLARSAEK